MTEFLDNTQDEEHVHLLKPDPDVDLVKQAQMQLPYQTSAYETLMKRHQKVLSAVCFRLVDNPDDVEDVVQEVMVKVYGALKNFEYRSSFKTWIIRIAMNTCSNMREKLKRSRDILEMLSNDALQPKKIEISTDLLDAHKLLNKLDKMDKELLTLRFIANLKFEEVSEITGLSISATKMRIYRATEKLKSLSYQR